MSFWHLVLREIRHRKWNFVFALLSVTAAVGSLVASLTMLKADSLQTERILDDKQREVEAAVAGKREAVRTQVRRHEATVQKAGVELKDAMRKITKGLGFNVFILPAKQNLTELHTNGTLSETMPESYVSTLSDSKIMTINHILPMLTHRIENWDGPQTPQTILIVGTRGEVPFSHRAAKKPLKDGQAVEKGSIVVGYEIHRQQKLKPGDKLKLLGAEFTVTKLHEQRGTMDDNTVWVNLRQLQELLGKQNLVNAILALECNCASADRVGEIRKDIQRVLPGTQVLERDASKALARAEARNTAKKAAEERLKRVKQQGALAIAREEKAGREALANEQTSREELTRQREAFVSVLIPTVIFGCAVWIGLLTYINVRQRSGEIGILRAIGLRSREILTVFLSKAVVIGLLGGVLGYAAGFSLGVLWSDTPNVTSATASVAHQLFELPALLLALGMAPLLAGLASWLPAVLAARQDPAVVLQAE